MTLHPLIGNEEKTLLYKQMEILLVNLNFKVPKFNPLLRSVPCITRSAKILILI